MRIKDDFHEGVQPQWQVTTIGQAAVTPVADALRLTVQPTDAQTYSDAQISDYTSGRDFRWRPPLRMTVRAYADNLLHGTAGFGFWNQPFMPGEWRVRLPQAVWFFFGSPPNNMALAHGVPGHGWKAATFNAKRWPFLALLPFAPLGFLLMRIPALVDRLWPVGQRAIGVSERLLDSALLTKPHTYTLDWLPNQVTFQVDGETVHQAKVAIPGPLGFVAWVDNQYAVVTPQGHFGFGRIPIEHEQTLTLESVAIEPLNP
jgi:hypothetical protein